MAQCSFYLLNQFHPQADMQRKSFNKDTRRKHFDLRSSPSCSSFVAALHVTIWDQSWRKFERMWVLFQYGYSIRGGCGYNRLAWVNLLPEMLGNLSKVTVLCRNDFNHSSTIAQIQLFQYKILKLSRIFCSNIKETLDSCTSALLPRLVTL